MIKLLQWNIWNKEDVCLDDLKILNHLLNNKLNFYLNKIKNLTKLTFNDYDSLAIQSYDLNLENILSDIVRNAKIGLDCSKPIN